jgi:RNA polymerase sigma factor (sigma-70 family)
MHPNRDRRALCYENLQRPRSLSDATHMNKLLPSLYALSGCGPEQLTDADLLKRFAGSCDNYAFSALVQRHGQMVFNVCRGILGRSDDAEDAFQATFIVLLKKAPSLEAQSCIRNWLFGVASRVAAKAKTTIRRRQAREMVAVTRAASDPHDEAANREASAAVLEELRRLPARYREPLVLCYLYGKSKNEVAVGLGIPVGTVSSNLVRGRKLLRTKLFRRGVALSLGTLAAGWHKTASAKFTTIALTAATLPTGLAGRVYRQDNSGIARAVKLANSVKSTQQLAITKKLVKVTVCLLMLAAIPIAWSALSTPRAASETPSYTPFKAPLAQLWAKPRTMEAQRPVLENFSAVNCKDGTWEIRGIVTSAFSRSCVVNLGARESLIVECSSILFGPNLLSISADVNSDGEFRIVIPFKPPVVFTFTAIAVDPLCQTSDHVSQTCFAD